MEYIKFTVSADISTDEYIRDYVNIEEFLGFCRQCPNYGKVWSCPPYDFDPMEIWRRYDLLHIEGTVIKLPEEEVCIKRTPEEIRRIEEEILMAEKSLLSGRLYRMEDENSLSLSAGCCTLCTGCTRPSGKECRHADKMRYSLESLGANVGLTCSKLLGVTLEWVAENHLPHQICLISGLLK